MPKKIEISRDSLSNTNSLIADDKKVSKNPKPKKIQPNQLLSWFFTFNNYTDADILLLETKFKEICSSYIFEKEVGKSGTPHLQGVIKLKDKMRYSEFELPKSIHWESTKNYDNAVKYCQKDFIAGSTSEIYSHGITIKKMRPGIDDRRPVILPELNRPFQKFVIDKILKQQFDGKCHWFHDYGKGQLGKTTLAKYIDIEFNAIFFNKGKCEDVCHTVLDCYKAGNPMNIFVVNLPRSNKGKISWCAVEQILDGWIYSCKYEGGKCVFAPPHLFVFSNSRPDMTGFEDEDPITESRIECYGITEDFEIVLDNFWRP